jgi:hypothetical protein
MVCVKMETANMDNGKLGSHTWATITSFRGCLQFFRYLYRVPQHSLVDKKIRYREKSIAHIKKF